MWDGYRSMVLIAMVLLLVISCTTSVPLAGVVLTTGKDTRVFEKSIHTALKYLVDIDNFYVITPDKIALEEKFGKSLGKRVHFIDEKIFPFNNTAVAEVMIQSVKDRGKYPINGNTVFERTVWMKNGWFLQQILKLYAGIVLELDDYVLLDSDVIWFQPIHFLNHTNTNHPELSTYNYASSGQYHQPYFASLKKIGGVDMFDFTGSVFRSGIVHHMVIVKAVLHKLKEESEALHHGNPFWKVLLNESAAEMTCRAPREQICGAGSTLSEYELYFNYARNKYPQTLNFRPLLWANGPMPGLLYWPAEESDGKLVPDRHKHVWLGHRQNQGKSC